MHFMGASIQCYVYYATHRTDVWSTSRLSWKWMFCQKKNIKIVHRWMKYDKVCRRLMYLLKVAVCSAYNMFIVQTENAGHIRHNRILPLKKKLSEVLCNFVRPKTLDKLSVNIDHV